MNVEVFHGTDMQSITPIAWKGQNLYSVYNPHAPTGFLSNDIRYSIIFAGGIGRGIEVVSSWSIPEELLIAVDENDAGSRWFITNLVAEPKSVPLRVLRLKKLNSYEQAEVAVARGEIQFCYVPREYYQQFEAVDTILARFKNNTE